VGGHALVQDIVQVIPAAVAAAAAAAAAAVQGLREVGFPRISIMHLIGPRAPWNNR